MSTPKKNVNVTDDVVVIGDPTGAEAHDADVVVLSDDDADVAKIPKHAIMQDDGSVILPLRYPRTIRHTTTAGGVVKEDEYVELHMHRLNGADMRAVSAAAEGKRSVVAIARSARMREGLFAVLYDKMDGADTLACALVLGFFLNSGPATGR